MHIPVMPTETLELLDIHPDGAYLDATAGLGGHTGLIAQRLTTGIVIANDRDPQSLEMARRNTAEWAGRIRFHHGSFGELPQALREAGLETVDGLLADLGVSRYQLTAPERGFSFLSDGPLDMRMDQTTGMTAHTELTTSGRCGGVGRAPDGPFASRHEDVHGAANGGQR